MPREISPGFHWLMECGPDRSHFVEGRSPAWHDPDRELHIPQCVYVLEDERSLMLDTLSPASADRVVEDLEAVLDGGLDYLVVSHPDVPHAGNAFRILEAFPEATLVAPAYGSAHELYHLEDAMHVEEGDSLDLGRFTVDFHEATFLDAALHLWMTERETGTLFPVDWMGFPHTDAECLRFVDEFDHDVTPDRLMEFHGRVLFWYQYVDVPKVNAEIDRLIGTYDPDVIAPAHGNVIREDATEYMRMVKTAVERIDEQGRVGTLG